MRYRTHNCNELRKEDQGKTVKLAGFIKRVRNFGEIIFLDLRDHYGTTQIVITDKKLKDVVSSLNKESTIGIEGIVKIRQDINENLPTGDIEIIAENIEVYSKCVPNLPFEINDEYMNNKEELRLQYRYLDLRNEKIHNNIVLRSRILKRIREFMDSKDFLEIQTPILANSSPEGARDFLVPSRLHPGEFYALPQAPQQFKQILMVSGFDKYYQIAPCFRDEDPRADRSPGEFYQLDFEMSFATQEEVLEILEELTYDIFTKFTDAKVDKLPFKKIPFFLSMEKYGTDKPDLRNPIKLVRVTEVFNDTDINIFKDKNVYMVLAPKVFGRKYYDRLTDLLKREYEAKGLAWLKSESGECSGGVSKLITDDILEEMVSKLDEDMYSLDIPLVEKDVVRTNGLEKFMNYDYEKKVVQGDYSLFLIADEDREKAQKLAGVVRNELGKDCELIDENAFKFAFITDFPFFEKDDEGNIDFSHNPFSMPNLEKIGGKENLENVDPYTITAYQYDLVGNGFELASGACRNYEIDLMKKIFGIVGYSEEDVEKDFGALYTSFKYGVPPHAGAAPGIDRMIMLMAGEENIREVIAFPKNKKARDTMVNAPSTVYDEQLEELGISIVKKEEEKDK